MQPKGIEIESISAGSLAEQSGLRSGDILLSVNSHPLNDVIDFMFYKNSEELDIEFRRKGNKNRIQITIDNKTELGLQFRPLRVSTCKNNCIFCFVKQLPKGLRKTLYVKDEDYRLSFLYGNYITFSNMDNKDKKRIVQQRLSPLYISVHTTNKSLRNKMLGNPKASDIMKEMKFLSENKIRMHLQIVLCPGYNDGKELRDTINDIYRFYPYASSIAVVPVGLTMHRKLPLDPVTKEHAIKAIGIVESFQKRFIKKHGDPIVYCADEMYIKADTAFPKLKDYGVFPQIENGVGLVPFFINQTKKIKIPGTVSHKKKFLTFTGVSFYPFLKKFFERLEEKENIHINIIKIENNFFGKSVTVTGLLTGRDLIKALHEKTDSYNILLVPDVVLKEGEDILLDNVSLKDIEEATGLKTVKTDSSPQGLIDAISGL